MIGFVIPLAREANELLPFIEDRQEKHFQNRTFYEGKIGCAQCVVVVSGHGKILSAASTQHLISHYSPDWVLHMGSGGALSSQLKIGDFVIGEKIIEHDYIERFCKRRNQPTSVSDQVLIQKLSHYASCVGKVLHKGKIISGNEDVVETSRRDLLFAEYGGLSVDWESCACATVCNQARTPVLVVRAITDYAYENTTNEYSTHAGNVNKLLSEFLVGFIKSVVDFLPHMFFTPFVLFFTLDNFCSSNPCAWFGEQDFFWNTNDKFWVRHTGFSYIIFLGRELAWLA